MSNLGLVIIDKFDPINRLILLSVIPLSSVYCTLKKETKVAKCGTLKECVKYPQMSFFQYNF